MEEENQILDGEDYRNLNEGNTYKEMAMRLVQKVITNSCQEMRAGFWIYSQPKPNMNPDKIRYVGDSRKELRASLDCLHDLLLPKFDKDMTTKSKEIYKEIKELTEAHKKKNLKEKSEAWTDLLKNYRTLFQELCLFLERIGWLDAGEIDD